jgi:hypothetical protein
VAGTTITKTRDDMTREEKRKSLHIGRKIKLLWYHCEETAMGCSAFNNIDMFYCHIGFFHNFLELHYYHRL